MKIGKKILRDKHVNFVYRPPAVCAVILYRYSEFPIIFRVPELLRNLIIS